MKRILDSFNIRNIVKEEYGKRRLVMMFMSILLMGFSVSVFSYSNLGVDPFTSMNMGISARLGVGFGFYQMCVNAVLLSAVVIFGKELIGVGTVVNMVGVGYICQFFTALYSEYLPSENSMAVRLALMISGVVLLSLSASMYFTSSLGVAPYDAVGFIIEHRADVPYKWCRVITDVICTVVGFAFGGPVGIGTVVTAFCMGPVISFFNKHVSPKMLTGHWFSPFELKARYYDFTKIGGGFVPVNGRH